MSLEYVFPLLPDDPSLGDLNHAVRELEELSCLFRLSDLNFLTYASGLLKCVRSEAKTLLAHPPAPWSRDQQPKGLLTFKNYAEEVVENTQAVHQLLFRGALQTASLAPDQPVLNQLKQSIQKLATSLKELDSYIQDSSSELDDRSLYSMNIQQTQKHSPPDHSNGKAVIHQPPDRLNGKAAHYE